MIKPTMNQYDWGDKEWAVAINREFFFAL